MSTERHFKVGDMVKVNEGCSSAGEIVTISLTDLDFNMVEITQDDGYYWYVNINYITLVKSVEDSVSDKKLQDDLDSFGKPRERKEWVPDTIKPGVFDKGFKL